MYYKAHLANADLRRANLSKARLHKANLVNADLRKAKFSNAELFEADLTRAKYDDNIKEALVFSPQANPYR